MDRTTFVEELRRLYTDFDTVPADVETTLRDFVKGSEVSVWLSAESIPYALQILQEIGIELRPTGNSRPCCSFYTHDHDHSCSTREYIRTKNVRCTTRQI